MAQSEQYILSWQAITHTPTTTPPAVRRLCSTTGAKLVVVEETKIEPRELLELVWWSRDKRKRVQRLEPGEYDARW